MRPLRILAVADVSPLAVVGGAERTLWEQTRRLARRGHDVRILCRAPGAAPPASAVRDGVRIVEFAPERRSPVDFLRSTVVCRKSTGERRTEANSTISTPSRTSVRADAPAATRHSTRTS